MCSLWRNCWCGYSTYLASRSPWFSSKKTSSKAQAAKGGKQKKKPSLSPPFSRLSLSLPACRFVLLLFCLSACLRLFLSAYEVSGIILSACATFSSCLSLCLLISLALPLAHPSVPMPSRPDKRDQHRQRGGRQLLKTTFLA